MISQPAIKILEFIIKHFHALYEYLAFSIDYGTLASRLKILSFIVDYMAESIKILGSLYA